LTSVLESMLDASGFSMGFGCTLDSRRNCRMCEQLGLGDRIARDLAARWQTAYGSAPPRVQLFTTVSG
jgi:hypothetical protein